MVSDKIIYGKTMDFKRNTLYTELRERILRGDYENNYKFPKELEFARELGVGKVTLRAAWERLEEEQLIKRIPGKGTFVQRNATNRTILIIISRDENIASPSNYIIPGITKAAGELGFSIERCYINDLRKMEYNQAMNLLKSKNLAGCIIIVGHCNKNDLEMQLLQNIDCPAISAHGYLCDRHFDLALMYVDERAAFREAMEHLVAQGHSDIAVLMPNFAYDIRGYSEEEFASLAKSLGFKRPKTVYYFDDLQELYCDITKDGMPSAILAYSDFCAIDFMEILKEHGIKVPEDIAMMGFCGYPGGAFLQPRLSTIDYHYEDIGYSAVKLLNDYKKWYQQPNVEKPLILTPFTLKIEESTQNYNFNNKK